MILSSLPDIPQSSKPVIGNFNLVSIYNPLFEEAIAIANPISKTRIARCSKRIHKGSSQTTETTISKSHVMLSIFYSCKIHAHFCKTIFDSIKDPKIE